MYFDDTAKCGCKVDVELETNWEYGCAGSCCPSYEVTTVQSVEILEPCATHKG